MAEAERVYAGDPRPDSEWVRFVPGDPFDLSQLEDDEFVFARPPDGWDVYRHPSPFPDPQVECDSCREREGTHATQDGAVLCAGCYEWFIDDLVYETEAPDAL